MATKTLLQNLVNVAANVNLSKKVRREAVDTLKLHFKESKLKVPSFIGELEEQLAQTKSGAVARPQSVVGAMITELLMETNDRGYRKYSHDEIAEIVKEKVPGAATTAKSVASTLRDLDPAVKAQVPPRKAKSDKAKPEALRIDLDEVEFEAEEDEDESEDQTEE